MTTYRFYGARHSIVGLGNMVNFEIEQNEPFLPRLRDLMHRGFDWLLERDRVQVWHSFCALFYPHLKDTTHLESFYYDLLYDAAKRFSRQNPKRVVLESYVKLLAYEGRLHLEKSCYICHGPIGGQLALMRAFIPAHEECIFGSAFESEKLYDFLQSGASIELDELEVEHLYDIVLKGL